MGLRTGLSAHARQLPDRLDDLHGPWHGTVVLPVHLTWHQLREFDAAAPHLSLNPESGSSRDTETPLRMPG